MPRLMPSRKLMPAVTQMGRKINSSADRPRPSIRETTITTSVSFRPSLSDSHFSNLEGSSSSSPRASADAPSVLKLNSIDSTKETTPRIRGRSNSLFFCLTDTNSSSVTTRLPSSFRQVVTIRLPAFIITPSSTACPPTLPSLSEKGQDDCSLFFFIKSSFLVCKP